MEKREQINIRLDAELRAAIEDMRAMVRPIPTITDIVREAIIERRDRIKRKRDAEARP